MAEGILHQSKGFVDKIPHCRNYYLLCTYRDGDPEPSFDWIEVWNKSSPSSLEPDLKIDYDYKILMIGDARAGQTHILRGFTDEVFDPENHPRDEVTWRQKIIELEGEIIRLNIWNPKVRKREKTVRKTCYHDARGIMLVYDVTDYMSFVNIKLWVDKIYDQVKGEGPEGKPMEIILIGSSYNENKYSRQVSFEQGSVFASKHNYPFYELSGNELFDVNLAFYNLAHAIMNNDKLEEICERLELRPSSPQRRRQRSNSTSKKRNCYIVKICNALGVRSCC